MKWIEMNLSSKINVKHHYNNIDIIKFIFSLFVVGIHTEVFINVDKNLHFFFMFCICRLVVPFFFVSSGYFLFRKVSVISFDDIELVSCLKKIINLYIKWSIIYLPTIIYTSINNSNNIYSVLLVIIRSLFFTGYYHLWYLLALIVAIILIVIISKRLNIKTVFLIAVLIYFAGNLFPIVARLLNYPLINSIVDIYQLLFVNTKNGIFEGLVYVAMGGLFANISIYIEKKIAIAGFIISMMLVLIEVLLIYYFKVFSYDNAFCFVIPAVFFFFYVITHIEINQNKYTRKLRNYSSLIYYTHMWPIFIINTIIPFCFNVNISYSLFRFVLSMLLTMIIIKTIEHKRKYIL